MYDDTFMLMGRLNVLFHMLITIEDFKKACLDIMLDAEHYEADMCIAYMLEEFNIDIYSVVVRKFERKHKKIKT